MTTWRKNEATAAARQCVLDIAAITDGSPAPHATSFSGAQIQIRLGGTSWANAGGTLTNTGFDGHWVYQALQSETNVTTNEVELRIVDATYFAQTLVTIEQPITALDVSTIVEGFMSFALRTGRTVRGMLRRQDALTWNKITGMNGSTVTCYQPDDTTVEFSFSQNTTAGSRTQATVTNSEIP